MTSLPARNFLSASSSRLRVFTFIFLLLIVYSAKAAETFPPAPKDYFNDYAGVTRADTRSRLNDQLQKFEQDTSSQVVVAVFPKLDSQRPYDDYSIRLFNAWQIGRKGKDNGIGLFVYLADHKAFICTGKGMEGALPDATSFAIVQNEIIPRFRQNDFDGGLSAAVDAIIAATRGEYKGTGTTVYQNRQQQRQTGENIVSGLVWLFIILIFFIIPAVRAMRGGYSTYDRYGRRRGGWYWGGYGGGFGGGFGGGGGGFGGGGGGGFSGGGGSSGGGGAGGSW